MHHLAATLHTLGIRATTTLHDHLTTLHAATTRPSRHLRAGGPERGSVTIEQVIWAVAVIAIVGIVVAAVKAYVTTQAGNIR
jgi:hypothetical protein